MAVPEANAEQIRYWNEAAGPKWVAFQKVIDAQIAPLGEHAMDRANIAPGERVIDVGCGCGDTTIALGGRVGAGPEQLRRADHLGREVARQRILTRVLDTAPPVRLLEIGRRVGPAGLVLGIDISAPMLERAVETAGAANVRFQSADAQTHRLSPGAFDVVYSRFGVMFFADPAAAFANLRAALRPGGRLAFVCWQALPENPWLFVPLRAAAQHLTLPPPPAPDAPGPFAFADPERVRGILARAGFEQIVLDELRATLTLGGGGTVEQAVRFLTEGVGPVSGVLREADPALRPTVAAAVRAAIAPFHTPEGVRMGSAAWIVTALAP